MLYFNLMSAINLYVAVDWQGDREIERAGERLQRETGRGRGARRRRKREIQSCGGRNGRKDGKRQYKRRREREESERENIHKRPIPRRFY